MFRTWIKPAAYAMTARLVIAGHNRERSITESEFGGNRGSIPRAQRPDRVHSPQRIYCQIVDYMVRLPYCALNGRTLLSTRINAVSAPLMLPELKDSATFPKGEMEEREEKKKDEEEEEASKKTRPYTNFDAAIRLLLSAFAPIVPTTSFHSVISSSREKTWILPLSLIFARLFLPFLFIYLFFFLFLQLSIARAHATDVLNSHSSTGCDKYLTDRR